MKPTWNTGVVKGIAAITLGSGLVNLASVVAPAVEGPGWLLRGVFPLEFQHLSRFLVLLTGFALVISSINIYKRKRRACQVVAVIAAASAALHFTKGLDVVEGIFSLVVFFALIGYRGSFTVKSVVPDYSETLWKLALGAALALGYGILGFRLLDRRHFGVSLSWLDAVRDTIAALAFSPPSNLVPLTAYGRWFLQSFYLITTTAIIYGTISIFRPVVQRYRTLPHEAERAERLVQRFGQTALDYFKYWPDKSFFFSPEGDCFIAYRVAGGCAIALGDPVGESHRVVETVGRFLDLCRDNDWKPAFYQTTSAQLPAYKSLGMHRLKIGDEAVVELSSFTLEGREMRKLRTKVQRFEEAGFRAIRQDPPVSEDVLRAAQDVSDDWLDIPGRRERFFTLGSFSPEYLRSTPIFAVCNRAGTMLAFANIVPSYGAGETTVDLMRHRADAPNGTMDYLFVKVFQDARQRGFQRFTLGLAPMATFSEKEGAPAEEKAIHYFFQHLNFIFSYAGIQHYKAKFASTWVPRYLIYRNVVDLPRIALSLAGITGRRREAA